MLCYVMYMILDIYIYSTWISDSRTTSVCTSRSFTFFDQRQGPEGGPPESSILAKFWRPGHSKVPFFRYLYDPNVPQLDLKMGWTKKIHGYVWWIRICRHRFLWIKNVEMSTWIFFWRKWFEKIWTADGYFEIFRWTEHDIFSTWMFLWQSFCERRGIPDGFFPCLMSSWQWDDWLWMILYLLEKMNRIFLSVSCFDVCEMIEYSAMVGWFSDRKFVQNLLEEIPIFFSGETCPAKNDAMTGKHGGKPWETYPAW